MLVASLKFKAARSSWSTSSWIVEDATSFVINYTSRWMWLVCG